MFNPVTYSVLSLGSGDNGVPNRYYPPPPSSDACSAGDPSWARVKRNGSRVNIYVYILPKVGRGFNATVVLQTLQFLLLNPGFTVEVNGSKKARSARTALFFSS